MAIFIFEKHTPRLPQSGVTGEPLLGSKITVASLPPSQMWWNRTLLVLMYLPLFNEGDIALTTAFHITEAVPTHSDTTSVLETCCRINGDCYRLWFRGLLARNARKPRTFATNATRL